MKKEWFIFPLVAAMTLGMVGCGESPVQVLVVPVDRPPNRLAEAQAANARATIAMIKTAIRVYEMDMGTLPPALDALITDPGETRWHGPYLPELPLDPWGHPYVYTKDGQTFDVTSTGLRQ